MQNYSKDAFLVPPIFMLPHLNYKIRERALICKKKKRIDRKKTTTLLRL